MATNTANTDTASIIHNQILKEEELTKDSKLSLLARIRARDNITKLKRELNGLNYEASLQAPD